tara:strand:+ start:2983 stop:3183 length:201 start_codon:yes stop_codon:yes gene_type:complete
MTTDEMWEDISDVLDEADDPESCLAIGLNILTGYLDLNEVTKLSANTGDQTVVVSVVENDVVKVLH